MSRESDFGVSRDLILIVEDEERLAQVLKDYLEASGFEVVLAFDGEIGLSLAREKNPDLILLDLMLPSLDGTSICEQLREHSQVPILMVTAKCSESERLAGFEVGADDYISKPFSPREVVARVQAVLKRARSVYQKKLSALLTLREAEKLVLMEGDELDLTPKEYELLRNFLLHPGQVFSRDRLLCLCYDASEDVNDRAIDSHIKNLRKKLAKRKPGREFVQSVYGQGYRFSP